MVATTLSSNDNSGRSNANRRRKRDSERRMDGSAGATRGCSPFTIPTLQDSKDRKQMSHVSQRNCSTVNKHRREHVERRGRLARHWITPISPTIYSPFKLDSTRFVITLITEARVARTFQTKHMHIENAAPKNLVQPLSYRLANGVKFGNAARENGGNGGEGGRVGGMIRSE
ncbi:hypothetical protein WH47_12747 [Habropoda laboriosa]|uniref:Uncharacterized protein n=1 Tax=Habropoda laboriosa TaxID=597456 RepID=A0A0L7R524_9HYME|nr:hypothetical protein WH47_12747 [Habropoda laboriosa]